MTFDEAFLRLIGHEGGYVADSRDPGGETKFGISRRSYPGEDIKGMTLARAKTIYARDFWGPAGCDAVPDGIKFDLFDTAVNAGPGAAIRMLQKALGVTQDGVIGPKTMQAISSMDPERLDKRFNGHRLDHLNNLDTWPDFGRGWAQRIAENLMKD